MHLCLHDNLICNGSDKRSFLRAAKYKPTLNLLNYMPDLNGFIPVIDDGPEIAVLLFFVICS